MKIKTFFISTVSLFFLSLLISSCNNTDNSQSAVDTVSAATTAKEDSTMLNNNDTVPSINLDTVFAVANFTKNDSLRTRRKSAEVFEMKWPAGDFLTKVQGGDVIKFKFISTSSGYILKAVVFKGNDSTDVLLKKRNNVPFLITSTGSTNQFWLRESKLSKSEIQNDIINKVVNEQTFRELLTNAKQYNIIVTPGLQEQTYQGVTTQYVGLVLRVENVSSSTRSINGRATNPCPVCN